MARRPSFAQRVLAQAVLQELQRPTKWLHFQLWNIDREIRRARLLSENRVFSQGDNLGRPCLNMDVSQIDTDKYTHIHFGFGTLSEYFKVMVGNDRTQFEFERFKLLRGVKRILSIGGWDFSTNPDTYMNFRNVVLPANRYEAAQNIANFVNGNGLDGVDIDWEYPGVCTTPGL